MKYMLIHSMLSVVSYIVHEVALLWN